MNILTYLLKDARNKDGFKSDDVYEDENERLDCESDIDRDEIEDLRSRCAMAKEIKERYDEEEDAVMYDPWSNGALIDKEGNPTILRFKIP